MTICLPGQLSRTFDPFWILICAVFGCCPRTALNRCSLFDQGNGFLSHTRLLGDDNNDHNIYETVWNVI